MQYKKKIFFDPSKQITSPSFHRNVIILGILGTLIAGGISYISGILSSPIGQSLGYSSTDLGFIALINAVLFCGNLTGSCCINFLIRRFTCRGTLFISGIVILGSALLLAFDGLFIVKAALKIAIIIFVIGVFFSGVAFGAMNNCATFLLVGYFRIYKKDNLWANIAQGSVALATAGSGFLAAIFITSIKGTSWFVIYFFIALLGVLFLILIFFKKTGETRANLLKFFTNTQPSPTPQSQQHAIEVHKAALERLRLQHRRKSHKIPGNVTLGVIFCAIAVGFYMMIENTQTFWYGSYIANIGIFKGTSKSASSVAAFIIALFWTGIAAGRYTIRILFPKVKDIKLILLSLVGVFAGLALMAQTVSLHNEPKHKELFLIETFAFTLILGVSISVIYPTLLNAALRQSVKAVPINQILICIIGISGAIVANIVFFLISKLVPFSTSQPWLANAIPLFYAPFIALLVGFFAYAAYYWRHNTVKGKLVTEMKGIFAEELNVRQKYLILHKNINRFA